LPDLRDYHLLPAVRGDLLVKLGRMDEARTEFLRAAELTQNDASAPSSSTAPTPPEGGESHGPSEGRQTPQPTIIARGGPPRR
jgi:hypothetical protein